MTHSLDRRDFLHGTLAATGAALTGLAAPAAAPRAPAAPADKRPLFLISLAEWSLHRALFGRAGARRLDHLDFPRTAKNDYGIDAVEYVNQFFKDKARDERYLGELKKRCTDLGVRSLLIMCDGEGRLGDPDAKMREVAVRNHHKWVEAAKFLGCHSIRVNAYSAGTFDEQMKLTADGLSKLTEFGARHEINVIVENHGGLSSNGAWLAATIRRVNNPRCGTLPDFGNFPVGADRYEAVRLMMPFAKAVSAKSHDFDAGGNETHTDYTRMMRLVIAAGYRGHLGIEYEGNRLSEPDGIRATKRLLEKVRTELSPKA